MSLHHIFNVEEATKYGLEKAILIYNMRFWLTKNKANGVHFYDGYVWFYNSSEAFHELFPYMAPSSIARYLRELEQANVIKSANYNKSGYDRTKWYTIVDEFPVNQNDKSISQNDKSNCQYERPIPDINTDIDTDNNIINEKPIPKRRKDSYPNPVYFPDDFTITDELRNYCTNKGLDNPDNYLEDFKDYHEARGTKFMNWNCAFKKWMRNVKQWQMDKRSSQNGKYVNPKLEGIKHIEQKYLRAELGESLYDENGNMVSYDIFSCLRESEPTIQQEP